MSLSWMSSIRWMAFIITCRVLLSSEPLGGVDVPSPEVGGVVVPVTGGVVVPCPSVGGVVVPVEVASAKLSTCSIIILSVSTLGSRVIVEEETDTRAEASLLFMRAVGVKSTVPKW